MKRLIYIMAALCFSAGVYAAPAQDPNCPLAYKDRNNKLQEAERKVQQEVTDHSAYLDQISNPLKLNDKTFIYLAKQLDEFKKQLDSMGNTAIGAQQAAEMKKMLAPYNEILSDADKNPSDPKSLYKQYHFEALPYTPPVIKALPNSLKFYNDTLDATKYSFKQDLESLTSTIDWLVKYGKK